MYFTGVTEEKVGILWMNKYGDEFFKFVSNRWPMPNGPEINTHPCDIQALEKETYKSYQLWVYDSFKRMLMATETWVPPYCSNSRLRLSNYPPEIARLKYPENELNEEINSITNLRGHVLSFYQRMIDNCGKGDWSLLHSYPYKIQTSLTNYMTEVNMGIGALAATLSQEDVKKDWDLMFTTLWPFPTDIIPEFNNQGIHFETVLKNEMKNYETWKERYWNTFWERLPGQSFASNPLPYDSIQEQRTMDKYRYSLANGFERTEFLKSLKKGAILTLWNDLWSKEQKQKGSILSILNMAQEAKFDQKEFSKPLSSPKVQLRPILDITFDWSINAENFNWGSKGLMKLRYPVSWPYPNQIETSNYGEFVNWPSPLNITDPAYLTMPESINLIAPSDGVMDYWRNLVEVFEKKNPRGLLDMDTTERKQKLIKLREKEPQMYNDLFTTNKLGYACYSANVGTANFTQLKRYDATDLVNVDYKVGFNTDEIIKWSEANLMQCMTSLGIHNGETMDIVYDDPAFPVWREAVFQALHLRLAYRQKIYPAQKWKSYSGVDKSKFPKKENALILIKEKWGEEKMINFWKRSTWAKNFLNKEQSNGKRPTGIYKNNVMPWESLQYLLYLIHRNSGSQGQQMDINKMHHKDFGVDLKKEFFDMIYHTGTNESEYDPQTEMKTTFFENIFQLYWYSSARTWDDALNFFAYQMYEVLVIKNQQSLIPYDVEGTSCAINPKDLNGNCIEEYVEENDPYNDAAIWKTDKGKLDLLWHNLENQWRLTQNLVKWPTWYYGEDGEWTVEKRSDLQEPSKWQKALNTITRFFKNKPTKMPEEGEITVTGLFMPVDVSFTEEMRQVVSQVRLYGLPILKSGASYSMTPTQWNEMVDKQWAAYREWTELNIKQRVDWESLSPDQKKVTHLIQVGEMLRDEYGNPRVDENGNRLYNKYFNFGVFNNIAKDDFSWLFDPGKIFEQIFGDTLFNVLINTFRRFMQILNVALKIVTDTVVGNLPLFLIAGAVIIGGSIVYKNIMK